MADEEEVEVAAKAAETIVNKAAKDAFQEAEEDVLKEVEQGAAKAGADAAGQDAARQALIDELKQNGVKFSEDDLVNIGRDRSGKVVFLEQGNSRAGLQHIMEEHADDFGRRGVPPDQVGDYVFSATTDGTVVGQQGRRGGRAIYEFVWNGETHRVAASVGSNGFIVGANPA